MRRVYLLLAVLVTANLLALGWWQGWTDAWWMRGGSPVERQIAAERVRPVPQARFEAARRPSGPGTCFVLAALEPAAVERVAAWVRERAGSVEGEAIAVGYRIGFTGAPAPAEVKARLAELAALAGREPAPCAN